MEKRLKTKMKENNFSTLASNNRNQPSILNISNPFYRFSLALYVLLWDFHIFFRAFLLYNTVTHIGKKITAIIFGFILDVVEWPRER